MLDVMRLALLALLCFACRGLAAEEVFIPQNDGPQNLKSALYYLDDPTERYSVEDVAAGLAGDFQPLTKPNYGFGYQGVRWIRFKIDLSKNPHKDWFLQQNYTHVQNWTIYSHEEGEFQSVRVSEDFPVENKPYTIPNFVVKLPNSGKSDAVYYVRYEPRGHALNIDLVQMSEKGLLEHVHAGALINGLFFGSLFILILYNLFLCVLLRSRVYAYYVYYLVFFSLAFVYLTGYAPLVVDQLDIRWEQVFAACSFTAMHGMTISGRSILNLRTALPKAEKILIFFEVLLLLGALGSFLMPVGLHYRILNPLILCAALTLLISSTRRALHGYQPARIYAIGWISFILMMMSYSLTFMGILPLNWFTTNAVKVSSVLEATLFSIALALRFKLGMEMAAKAKNAFLGMVSHELKTPLQTVVSCLDIISADGGVVRSEGTLKKLASAVRQLETQVGDLTDFAHLESGHLKLRMSDFNPADLVREVASQYEKSALEKQIQISVEILGKELDVHADDLRIKQIISNLIENAVKYTKQGFVAVRLAYSNTAEKPFLVIEVEDSGIGISQENIKSIYQPFVQVDQSLQRKYQGIGMGLTIIKDLVSLMDGKIEVDSTLNKGTVFTVTLPYGLPVTGRNSSEEKEFSSYKKLLLIDDDSEVRVLLGQILRSMQYDVTCCSSGRSALVQARVKKHDVVLLDINMPDLDGIAVAKKLRKLKFYAETPIVWISATRPTHTEKDNVEMFTHFLEKPIRAENLAQLLSRL